jgi:hypothetical protein
MMKRNSVLSLSTHPEFLVRKGKIMEKANIDDRRTKIICTIG